MIDEQTEVSFRAKLNPLNTQLGVGSHMIASFTKKDSKASASKEVSLLR